MWILELLEFNSEVLEEFDLEWSFEINKWNTNDQIN